MMKPQSIKELRSVRDMLAMKGKVALVTGAGGGIGRSTAAAFAELGAKVALMDIPAKEEELKKNVEAIKKRFGAEAMYVLGDVSDPASVESFIQQVVDAYGTIHIVHNNAGIGGVDGANIPVEAWNRSVGINLTGSFLVARTCARIMKEHGHGGAIVSTASMSGVIINTGPAYAATKAAVRHMTAALAMEYAKDNIRCNSVCYGYILSGMHESFGVEDVNEMYSVFEKATPMGRMGDLSEAVGAVVYLASDLATFHTGTSEIIDGGVCISRKAF
ncbi:MAG: SDR family oxidoreductase [Clostridiales bacterium]|nr:SDR family oxidoreductase [Clostridiales bacterium]